MSSYDDSDLFLFKKRLKKRKLKKIFLDSLIFLISFIFIVRFLFSEGAFLDYLRSKKNLNNKIKELSDLKLEIASLEEDINIFKNKFHQQNILKKKLGLIKKDEHILILSKNINRHNEGTIKSNEK